MKSPTIESLYRPLKEEQTMSRRLPGHVYDYARIALAAVRLVNGVTGLFFPTSLARRLGVDPKHEPAVQYVFRLFGIRTIIIGLALLSSRPTTRREALRTAVIIHASDTLAASIAGLQKHLPPYAAITTTLISTGNTLLALLAQPTKA